MSPALSVSLIWLLAMLSAAAHMAPVRLTLVELARAAGAYALTFWAASLVSPQPNWVGVIIGIASFWRLIAGPMVWMGPLVAGACAALAAALHAAGGLPFWPSAALGIFALLGGGFMLGRAPGGRMVLREHVLVATALATPAIGLAADIAYGWQSAAILNRAAQPAAALMPPLWAMTIIVLAITAGAIRGLWARR